MKIVIVDDDLNHCEHLKLILSKKAFQINEILIANSVSKGYEYLNKGGVDLVLLNVDLCDGGRLNLLSKYNMKCFEIIFMTDTLDIVKSILKKHELECLVKPVSTDLLKLTLSRVKAKLTANIFSNLPKEKVYKKSNRLFFKEKNGIRFVAIEQIIRCSSDNNYTEVYLENGERIVSSKTLKEYAIILEPYGFYRVHQSHLVDLKLIKKVVNKDGLFVELKNQEHIELSRRRKEKLLKKMAEI